MVTSNMDKKKAKEKEAQMNGFKQTKDQLGTNPNPYLKSYFPSKLSFWWMGSLFRLGSKKTLTTEDLYDALPEDRADNCMEQYDSIYHRLHTKNPKKTPTIWNVFVRMFSSYMLLTAGLVVIWEGIKIFQPVLVGWMILYFEELDGENTNGTTSYSAHEAYGFGAALAISSYINALPSAFYFAILQNVAMRMRAICCALIFRKSLRLSNTAMANVSTGRIVNLMSTDVEKFHNGLLFLHFYWVAPVEICVIMGLLYREVGWAFVPGLGLIILLLPIQLRLGKTFGYLRVKTAEWTDRRILVMSEIITGMRVIKMYCWEKPFGGLVEKFRKSEMAVIARAMIIKGLNAAIGVVSPKVVTMLIVVMYDLWAGEELDPARVVKVISWSELLRMGVFTFLSNAAQFGTEMFTSVKRIQDFLYAEELGDQTTAHNVSWPPGAEENRIVTIMLQGVDSKWDSTDPYEDPDIVQEQQDEGVIGFSLTGISVRVEEGQLIALAGSVGSGKSSLLMTLLGEMPISAGFCKMDGEVAYVPQESWVFAGTVRDNVLFGQRYNEFRYKEALRACALDRDLELMENGDQTLVGEKGFSLSGGQKARINLARAVYRDADIYLMDDPLSAVDTKVGKHIFQKCIRGLLKHKTRILITHQIQFLKDVDYVYIMKDGKIVSEGRHEELSHSMDLMRSVSTASELRNSKRRTRDAAAALRSSIRRDSAASVHSVVSISGAGELEADVGEAMTPAEEEDVIQGSVNLGVFARYFGAGKGVILFPIFLVLALGGQGVYNYVDVYLSTWKDHDHSKRLYIYIGLVVGMIVLGCVRSIVYKIMSCQAATTLHNRMFTAVLRSPMSFFDKNPTGRILNRFSRDTGFMDDILIQTFHQVWIFLLVFLGVIVFVTYTLYWTLLVTVPLIVAIIYLRHYTMKTMRDIKRIEATVRSPVYSHLSATLLGLPVLRAFKMEENFIDTFYDHQTRHNSAWFLFLSTSRWFGLRLDWLVATYYAGCIIASFIITYFGVSSVDGGQIGLALSYISTLLGIFQFIMRQTAEVESYMTSVERIQQYTTLPPEADEHTDVRPAVTWPEKGAINFQHMSLAYGPDAPNVLQDITLAIQGNEKIGIVGRTGAGKSSLISCLFRLSEPTGSIWIDNYDITTVGLSDVRKKISIIPQDPVLFSGTLRYNLDPLSEYEDEDLWKALDEVHLSDKVKQMEGFLSTEMAESGSNFSVGQRQLVCLARAILKRNRILVIDEATANVDQSTDKLIQKTLRTKFKDCTVLSIAHRLNTIIDSDKVLVLDHGQVEQFEHPHILLQGESGVFYEMVRHTGPATARLLTQMAWQAYEHKLLEEGEHVDPNTLVEGTEGSPKSLQFVTPDDVHKNGYDNKGYDRNDDDDDNGSGGGSFQTTYF